MDSATHILREISFWDSSCCYLKWPFWHFLKIRIKILTNICQFVCVKLSKIQFSENYSFATLLCICQNWFHVKSRRQKNSSIYDPLRSYILFLWNRKNWFHVKILMTDTLFNSHIVEEREFYTLMEIISWKQRTFQCHIVEITEILSHTFFAKISWKQWIY